MNSLPIRAFSIGAVLGLVLAVAPSCGGPSGGLCDPSSCATGCCANGQCLAGTAINACGKGGLACNVCGAGQSCTAGSCGSTFTGGGQGGGGGTGGGTAAACGAANCNGCCKDDHCYPGSALDTCGAGGLACKACGASGMCMSGVCQGDADAGTLDEQIAAVRASDGGTLPLNIMGATVTYLKPLVADAGTTNDPAGFFVQATKDGPAIFVAVDPARVAGGLAVGDTVKFTVTGVRRTSSIRWVTAVSNDMKTGTGPVSSLISNVSSVNFGDGANTELYDAKLVTLQGTTGAARAAGSGYRSYPVFTTGTTATNTDGGALQLRLPAALADLEDLAPGCTLTLTGGPMWRFNAQAQPSAFNEAELTGVTCPAPTVVSAAATSSTSVVVTFDRNIKTDSATAGAFSIAPTLSVSAAAAAGRTVTLTTDAQTAATSYTVTVANTVTDTHGTMLSSTANTAMFTGSGTVATDAGAVDAGTVDAGGGDVDAGAVDAGGGDVDAGAVDAGTVDAGGDIDAGTVDAGLPSCAPAVVISQVYGGGGNSGATYKSDFIEIHNRASTAVDVSTWSVQYASAGGQNWSAANLAGTIAPGGYLLVGLHAGATGATLPAADVSQTTMDISASNGKVALVNNQTLIPSGTDGGVQCPIGMPNVVDFVGFGSASCYEGTADAGVGSNTTANFRKDVSGASAGCQDTNNNFTDFTTTTPSPRNSAATPNACSAVCQ